MVWDILVSPWFMHMAVGVHAQWHPRSPQTKKYSIKAIYKFGILSSHRIQIYKYIFCYKFCLRRPRRSLCLLCFSPLSSCSIMWHGPTMFTHTSSLLSGTPKIDHQGVYKEILTQFSIISKEIANHQRSCSVYFFQ